MPVTGGPAEAMSMAWLMLRLVLMPLLVLALVALGLACRAQSDGDGFREKFQAIHAKLASHFDEDCCGFKDTEPATMQLLAEESSLLRQWAVAFLSRNRLPQADEFNSVIEKLTDQDASAHFVKLAPNLYVVTVDHYPVSDAFVIAEKHGHLQVAWTIKDAGNQRSSFAKYVRAWLGMNGSQIMGATVGGLSKSVAGEQRFWLEGRYAQSAGCDGTEQIGVWKWAGTAAVPLYVADYLSSCNFESEVTHVDGTYLHLYVLDFYKMFWRGGSGRELDWKLRITPSSVEDAGKTDVLPALEVLDRFFLRYARHMPVSDFAARAPAAKLKVMYDEIMRSWQRRGETSDTLGEYEIARSGTGYCFTLDPSFQDNRVRPWSHGLSSAG